MDTDVFSGMLAGRLTENDDRLPLEVKGEETIPVLRMPGGLEGKMDTGVPPGMLAGRSTAKGERSFPVIEGEETVSAYPPGTEGGNILPVITLPAAIFTSSGTVPVAGIETAAIPSPPLKNSLSPGLFSSPQGIEPARPELFQPENVSLSGDAEPELLQAMATRLPQMMLAAAGKKENPDLMSGLLAQTAPAVVVGTGSGGSATSVTNTPSLPLSPHMNSPQWQNSLGERVIWMVKHDLQQAELRLNPQHLGPVEVRIEVRNEQASITFSAHHAVTRDALETAVPRLREMLGEAGLMLANADVSQQRPGYGQQRPGHGQQQEGESRRQGSHLAGNGMENHGTEEMLAIRGTAYGGSGLIDIFA